MAPSQHCNKGQRTAARNYCVIFRGKIVATGPLWQCEEAVDFHTLRHGLEGLPDPRGTGPRIAALGDHRATDAQFRARTNSPCESGGI